MTAVSNASSKMMICSSGGRRSKGDRSWLRSALVRMVSRDSTYDSTNLHRIALALGSDHISDGWHV